MPFCTLVEWEKGLDSDTYDLLNEQAGGHGLPEGCLSRVVGPVDSGAIVIEVWKSREDAQRFSEQSAPALAQMQMPPPDRVAAFETAIYLSDSSGG